MTAAKYKIASTSERQKIKQAFLSLANVAWQEKPEQYCEYRMDGEITSGGWVRAKQFTNGTLYLEASSDELLGFMTGCTGSRQPEETSSGSKASTGGQKPSGNLNITGTYIGTDESGKGDFFGPLVIAGVMVTDKTAAILTELGVMDSKKLTDKLISDLSLKIIEVVGNNSVAVIEIGPAKYNLLYDKFKKSGKNLNHMLAWGHATAIENILENFPDCTQAVADQFGSEHYILSQLKDKGKQIQLMQTPRAEANVGVAAASILARHRFVSKLKKLSSQFGVELPPGAGPKVKIQAKRFLETHGHAKLAEVAKLHFKTTQEL